MRQLRFANEPQEGDGDVRSIDAGSPPTPMPACAKAARSRDTHGARGQWGDPVDLEVLGGVDLRQMDHSMARRVSSALGTARGTTPSPGPRNDPWFHRRQALALQFLARELAGAADGIRPLPRFPRRGVLVMAAELHLAEDAFALHLLLQHPERLVDNVVADENTLVSVTVYHTFGGEVEASNTPKIRRLTSLRPQ